MYNSRITLIDETMQGREIDGGRVLAESRRDVWANKKSVGMREFYEAGAQGFMPEIVFEVRDHIDYHGEKYIEHHGKRYFVIRTYNTGRKLEIVCQGVLNNGSAEARY